MNGPMIMSVINAHMNSTLQLLRNEDRANFVTVKKEVSFVALICVVYSCLTCFVAQFYHETQQLEWRTDVEIKTFHKNEGWWLAVDIKPTNDGFNFLPPVSVGHVAQPVKLVALIVFGFSTCLITC